MIYILKALRIPKSYFTLKKYENYAPQLFFVPCKLIKKYSFVI